MRQAPCVRDCGRSAGGSDRRDKGGREGRAFPELVRAAQELALQGGGLEVAAGLEYNAMAGRAVVPLALPLDIPTPRTTTSAEAKHLQGNGEEFRISTFTESLRAHTSPVSKGATRHDTECNDW